jgi:hypothetical protein
MYTDQTGRFPVTSSRGNKYIMVAVELDGNYIDAEPIKSRKAENLIKGYNAIWNRWEDSGVISPNWHILDNEAGIQDCNQKEQMYGGINTSRYT